MPSTELRYGAQSEWIVCGRECVYVGRGVDMAECGKEVWDDWALTLGEAISSFYLCNMTMATCRRAVGARGAMHTNNPTACERPTVVSLHLSHGACTSPIQMHAVATQRT
jgi:hypothetical protein